MRLLDDYQSCDGLVSRPEGGLTLFFVLRHRSQKSKLIFHFKIYYMKCSCIPNGSKMRKTISHSPQCWYHFYHDTCVLSFLNQSAFSIFARFSMVRPHGALRRLLFVTRAKNLKKLFMPWLVLPFTPQMENPGNLSSYFQVVKIFFIFTCTSCNWILGTFVYIIISKQIKSLGRTLLKVCFVEFNAFVPPWVNIFANCGLIKRFTNNDVGP